MRIVVAMSGGVDSSAAAAMLVDQGHDVVGLSMQLYDQREGDIRFGTCCTIEDLHDARRVAAKLGIPHYILNFERFFHEHVISNFVQEYVAGRTPIPCSRCNSNVKFSTLLDRALGLEAVALATGHYVRVHYDVEKGSYVLRRGTERARDQSYFLFSLTQLQLARAVFPIGGLSKSEVRKYAGERSLSVAEKPDSHEICFVPDGNYAEFVRARAKTTPLDGPIRDVSGRALGRHDGIHRFTVGQRKGLGLSSSQPLYVVELRPAERTVVVGPRAALERTTLIAKDVNWIDGRHPAAPVLVTAQIRHQHRDAPASVQALEDGRALVTFTEPQMAISAGQAVVFYEGDAVVGGGWIE